MPIGARTRVDVFFRLFYFLAFALAPSGNSRRPRDESIGVDREGLPRASIAPFLSRRVERVRPARALDQLRRPVPADVQRVGP